MTKHPECPTPSSDRPAQIRELARIIYDTIFLPGQEVQDVVIPPFEEAEAENLGGYERAVVAALAVALYKSRS